MKARFALLMLLTACAPRDGAGTMPIDETPPPLLPVAAFPGDFMLEQHVTARYRDREDGFDAVLQKRDDVLSLVGLGPMGTVAFVVNVTDAGVTLENNSPEDVPFSPAHIVADVQRVFYPWLSGEPDAEGRRHGEALDMTIDERFESGRLVERRFTRPDIAGAIVVTYEGWTLSDIAPTRVVLENGFYGYALEIETFSVRTEF